MYPEFNLLLQPDATNIHWSCDHLALAESQEVVVLSVAVMCTHC